MKHLARINSKSFLAFGFVACATFVGAQQTSTVSGKSSLEELMANAECGLSVRQERTDAFYAFFPDLNREKAPPSQKSDGVLFSLNGKKMASFVTRHQLASGDMKRTTFLRAWDAKTSVVKTWTQVGDAKSEVHVEKQASIDSTVDPTFWTYKIFGFTPAELVKMGKAKTHPEGNLVVYEGTLLETKFKAWVDPKHSNLIQRAEYVNWPGGTTRMIRIDMSVEQNGAWLPLVFVDEVYGLNGGSLKLLASTTTKFGPWKFGKVKEADLEIQASSPTH